MYEIEKTFSFEAGHVLKHHDGICRNPHGHSYQLTIKIRSAGLIQGGPKKNMVADFADISAIVCPMIKQHLDHQWINDTMNNDSPTVEFMAAWIYEQLEDKLPGLYAITLQETNSSKVTYVKRT
jgi:6-pyruvoyltetrahydropterin/6-carboxytetrahydropterin synthase